MRAVVVAAVVLAGCYDKAAEQPCTLSCEQAPCPGSLVCGADNLCQTAGLPACSTMMFGSDGGIDGDGGGGSGITVTAPNAGANDAFGTSIALSADGVWLVVGAPGEASGATGIDGTQSDDSKPAAGAAYVFEYDGTGYVFRTYLKAAATDSGDKFGTSVAISATGNVIAVGAPFEDGNGTVGTGDPNTNTAMDSGAVYVFSRASTVSAWSQLKYVKPPTNTAGQLFGTSVALTSDGSSIAIGAPGVGHSGWFFPISLSPSKGGGIPNASDSDLYGSAIALARDGNAVFFGGMNEDGPDMGFGGNAALDTAMDAGAVSMLELAVSGGTSHAYGKASNTGAGDNFGCSVAVSLDASVLAVGALREDSNSANDPANDSKTDSGAVYVFDRTSNTSFVSSAYLKSPSPAISENFGASVALAVDGAFLVVGAPGEAGGVASAQTGGVFTFAKGTSQWKLQQTLQASDGAPSDALGTSVAVSDAHGVVAAGAPGRAGNTGAVYVFR